MDNLLADLEYDNILMILAGFFALIPSLRLIQLYQRTKIVEYLTFASVFFLSTVFTVSTTVADLSNALLAWQITYFTRNTTYFLFFQHTSRMLWYKPPTYIIYPGVILYSITSMIILLWVPAVGVPGADTSYSHFEVSLRASDAFSGEKQSPRSHGDCFVANTAPPAPRRSAGQVSQ